MFARNLVRSVARSGLRRNAPLKRLMSSQKKQSSDMPWVIGSTLVFVPAFLYLVSPSRKAVVAHHGSHSPDDHAKYTPAIDHVSTEPEIPASDESSASDGKEELPEKIPSQSNETQSDDEGAIGSETDHPSEEQKVERDVSKADATPSQTSDSSNDTQETDESK